MAVEGDVGDAEVATVLHAEVRQVDSVELDRAAGDRAQAEDGFTQFELAVALDAGDAENLGVVHGERRPVDHQLRSIGWR